METKTNSTLKPLLLIIGGLLLMMSQFANAQDLPDYSQSDPDNIVNSEYDSIPSPTWVELNQEFKAILDTIKNKAAYKKAEESNTVSGMKKDYDSLFYKFINSTFVRWIENTETVKGIKQDINGDKKVKKEVKKEIKLPNKNVD